MLLKQHHRIVTLNHTNQLITIEIFQFRNDVKKNIKIRHIRQDEYPKYIPKYIGTIHVYCIYIIQKLELTLMS